MSFSPCNNFCNRGRTCNRLSNADVLLSSIKIPFSENCTIDDQFKID